MIADKRRHRRRAGAGIAFGGTAALVLGFAGYQATADTTDTADVVQVKSDHGTREKKARTAVATLRTADGTSVGTVSFKRKGEFTRVLARVWPGYEVGAVDAAHGFHIHANSNPDNGEGCVADPAAPASTWFVSADGHFADEGQTHSHHNGDLPSLLVNPDGSAQIEFTTARFTVADVKDKAVVLHAGPDNFGNVPTGNGADQYTANSPAAGEKTAATGNAGDRLACGVIRIAR